MTSVPPLEISKPYQFNNGMLGQMEDRQTIAVNDLAKLTAARGPTIFGADASDIYVIFGGAINLREGLFFEPKNFGKGDL